MDGNSAPTALQLSPVQSVRRFAISACRLARSSWAWCQLPEPGFLELRAFDAFLTARIEIWKKRGDSTTLPSERLRKGFRPKPIPTADAEPLLSHMAAVASVTTHMKHSPSVFLLNLSLFAVLGYLMHFLHYFPASLRTYGKPIECNEPMAFPFIFQFPVAPVPLMSQ